VNDAQGKLNETYKVASQTDVIKFDRAMASLKSTLIEVGQVALPIVTKLVEKFGDLLAKFEELSPGMQKFLAWTLAATAALFPLLSVIGSVTRAIGLLSIARTTGQIAAVGAAGTAVQGATAAGATSAAVGASFAGMAAYIPQVLIAAAITTAIVLGAKHGIKKFKQEWESSGGDWGKSIENTLIDALNFGGVFGKGGKLDLTKLLPDQAPWEQPKKGLIAYEYALNDAYKAVDEFAKRNGKASTQAEYLRQDLEKMGDIGMKKLMPDFNLDPTYKQVKQWRQKIMTELKIGAGEAGVLMRMWFGDRPFRTEGITDAGAKLAGLRTKLKEVRVDMARQVAFPGWTADKGIKFFNQIENLKKRIRKARGEVKKQFDVGRMNFDIRVTVAEIGRAHV
jgi:hypothetical protein